jgi:hypothetical protein
LRIAGGAVSTKNDCVMGLLMMMQQLQMAVAEPHVSLSR